MKSAGVAAAGLFFTAAALAAEEPGWLETARGRGAGEAAGRHEVVVLFEERMVDVGRSERKERVREAVRIMKPGARGSALAAAQGAGDQFKLVGAWKVRPDGEVTAYDKKAIMQADADASYEFSMSKVNLFIAPQTRAGDVIAWEYLSQSEPEAHETTWVFGGEKPTLRSRFGFRLPPDWTSRTVLRNAELTAVKDDEGFTVWEMIDVPALPDEPMMLPAVELSPSMTVAYGPPETVKRSDRRFDTWEKVAAWYAAVAGPQIVSDHASVRSTAAGLASGSASRREAIEAVARFAQGIRYLNTAVGRSVAEPHPAPLVLQNRYGDCEDKAILMMALLRALGVEAHPVLALTSRAGRVDPGFPGLHSFNHAIVAVAQPEGVSLPGSIDGGALGPLVLFDPTDAHTGFGDIPEYLQGTLALLAHPTGGRLVAVPELSPDASLRAAEVAARFSPEGGLEVEALIRYEGQYASHRRAHYGSVRGERRSQELAAAIASRHGKAAVTSFEVRGAETPGAPVELQYTARLEQPGRETSGLRTLPAGILLTTRAERLAAGKRITPLRIPVGYREAHRLTLSIPAGWRLASEPPDVTSHSDVGRYALAGRLEEGRLILERHLTVSAATVAPEGYAAVQRFFDDVAKGDSAGIVLERTAP